MAIKLSGLQTVQELLRRKRTTRVMKGGWAIARDDAPATLNKKKTPCPGDHRRHKGFRIRAIRKLGREEVWRAAQLAACVAIETHSNVYDIAQEVTRGSLRENDTDDGFGMVFETNFGFWNYTFFSSDTLFNFFVFRVDNS